MFTFNPTHAQLAEDLSRANLFLFKLSFAKDLSASVVGNYQMFRTPAVEEVSLLRFVLFIFILCLTCLFACKGLTGKFSIRHCAGPSDFGPSTAAITIAHLDERNTQRIPADIKKTFAL